MNNALKKECTEKSLLKIYRKARDVASAFVNGIYYCHSTRCK